MVSCVGGEKESIVVIIIVIVLEGREKKSRVGCTAVCAIELAFSSPERQQSLETATLAR
jgi:hypothetical protein